MAAAGFVALCRSCMDGLKSILTSQEFGAEYELLCAELSIQSLRFHLWGNSVGISAQASDHSHSAIIDRQDLQPTFDQAVSSIAHLLEEVEEIRRKYQLNRTASVDGRFEDDAKTLRASKSLRTLSSFKSTVALRQRIRENQKQKSFLAIAKWAICDARRFDEKVKRLKFLIDGLEDITKAAGLSHPETAPSQAVSTVPDDNPPPYSAVPLAELPNLQAESFEQSRLPEDAIPAHDTIHQAVLSAVLNYIPVMKEFLSACPDESRVDRSQVRSKLLTLSHQQFQELSEDVHDELLRRQRYDDQAPQCLPPNAALHPKRNEAREKLSTLHFLRFPQLVADAVFEFERRFPSLQGRVVPLPDLFSDTTSLYPSSQWGLCPPIDTATHVQYRPAHQSTSIDAASLVPISTPPTSSFSIARNFSRHRVPEPLYSPQPVTPQTPHVSGSEGRQWPMDRVQSWLAEHGFSSEWQEAFKDLRISGSVFLDLGNGHRSPGTFGMMHQRIYPRLAEECAKSGSGWDQATERAEGKRMRRLIRSIRTDSTAYVAAKVTTDVATIPSASVEIFKSFRVSMKDPTYKVLPAALKKYNIRAPWEQYALYILHGDNERCLGMEEKPLVLFKTLDKEGKKPMFMLRKIATAAQASAATSPASSSEQPPGGIV